MKTMYPFTHTINVNKIQYTQSIYTLYEKLNKKTNVFKNICRYIHIINTFKKLPIRTRTSNK